MNWKQFLRSEIIYTYKVTENLINLVDENKLGWKPSSVNNWMTTGQLLHHITDACGAPIRGFITGNWGLPNGVDINDLSPEDMLPMAEKFPTITSINESINLLKKDKQLALEMVRGCTENILDTQIAKAPWDSTEMILGHRILQMISHLSHHKSQLFYYLKLQGKDVNTSHLWGT